MYLKHSILLLFCIYYYIVPHVVNGLDFPRIQTCVKEVRTQDDFQITEVMEQCFENVFPEEVKDCLTDNSDEDQLCPGISEEMQEAFNETWDAWLAVESAMENHEKANEGLTEAQRIRFFIQDGQRLFQEILEGEEKEHQLSEELEIPKEYIEAAVDLFKAKENFEAIQNKFNTLPTLSMEEILPEVYLEIEN